MALLLVRTSLRERTGATNYTVVLVTDNSKILARYPLKKSHTVSLFGCKRHHTVPTQLFTDSCHFGLRTSWAKTKL